MQIVRDKEGLTYGIYSSIYAVMPPSDGHIEVNATFAPHLLDKGVELTRTLTKQLVENGVTQKEVEDYRVTIIGQFKISLSTSSGIAER